MRRLLAPCVVIVLATAALVGCASSEPDPESSTPPSTPTAEPTPSASTPDTDDAVSCDPATWRMRDPAVFAAFFYRPDLDTPPPIEDWLAPPSPSAADLGVAPLCFLASSVQGDAQVEHTMYTFYRMEPGVPDALAASLTEAGWSVDVYDLALGTESYFMATGPMQQLAIAERCSRAPPTASSRHSAAASSASRCSKGRNARIDTDRQPARTRVRYAASTARRSQ